MGKKISWSLNDLPKNKKFKVFSCFAAGGGSSLGYKLAGLNVIGINEIDPEMAQVYELNNNPKYKYIEDIRTFKERTDLPKELFELDILDGSPPCSTFSMAGKREKGWGKEKVFREGQAMQTLDDLFFDFIEVAKKLKPKIVVGENVKGILQGNAKGYVLQIINGFKEAGYEIQVFLLNSATMGVPQKRERVFFIGRRKDLGWSDLKLSFNEKPIVFDEAVKDLIINKEDIRFITSKLDLKLWKKCKIGHNFGTVNNGNQFNKIKIVGNKVCNTIASGSSFLHYSEPRFLTNKEILRLGSFPDDFKCPKLSLVKYVVGMSVPPKMMEKIALEIKKQWLGE